MTWFLVEWSDYHIYHTLSVAHRLYSLYSLIPIFTMLFLKRNVLQNFTCKSKCNYEYAYMYVCVYYILNLCTI